jgi:CRP-like cAMP-binding protein
MSVAHDLKPRILVLEDNYLTADSLCELVRDCGYDVAGAVGRVESAFEILQEREVDGAIVDINLHGDLSFPVCHELQRRNVPFVFLSGYDGPVIPDAFRSRRLLSKPIDRGDLRMALADFSRIQVVPRKRRAASGNALIDSAADRGFWALEARLERVSLTPGQVLHAARQPISYVYFPIDGLISLMARGVRGRRLEVGLVGSEGMTAVAALLDENAITATEAIVQLPTRAWRIAAKDLMSIMQSDHVLRADLIRYVRALIGQMTQTALATGHANIEQRVARWLLMASARCKTTRIEVTHEHLSQVLAVRRSGITVALHMLEARRVINRIANSSKSSITRHCCANPTGSTARARKPCKNVRKRTVCQDGAATRPPWAFPQRRLLLLSGAPGGRC